MKKVLLVLLVIVPGIYLQAQTLVGYWPLNGNANDTSGGGHNASVIGATLTTDRQNTANAAYQCAANQYLSVGNFATLKPTAAISFGGWFQKTSWAYTNTDEGMLGCTEGAGYELTHETPGVSAYVRRNGAYAVVTIPHASIPAGWHFFMGTYDGRFTRLYMDGTEVGTANDAGAVYPITYIGNDLLIGCEAGTTTANLSQPFLGKVDDIRIYNGALASNAINSLYLTTLPVHLEKFSVADANGAAAMSWTAENEKDFARYEVERSADGLNFSRIAQMMPRNNNARNVYTLSDGAIVKGVPYYYRIKMMDKDGSFSYSDVVRFSSRGVSQGEIGLYPNPATDYFYLKGVDKPLSVEVYNEQGSLIKRFRASSSNRYPVADLRTGHYTIRVQTTEKMLTTSLMR